MGFRAIFKEKGIGGVTPDAEKDRRRHLYNRTPRHLGSTFMRRICRRRSRTNFTKKKQKELKEDSKRKKPEKVDLRKQRGKINISKGIQSS